MTLFGGIYYLLASLTFISTLMAITRRNPVHAVVYLVISFFATALIFYLLGAPFLAMLEVIIYAGAIMILFLFILMTIQVEPVIRQWRIVLKQWLPAMILGGISFSLAVFMVLHDPETQFPLKSAMAGPAILGRFIFQKYWFPVEITSFLLLIALVGALYLGRREKGLPGKS